MRRHRDTTPKVHHNSLHMLQLERSRFARFFQRVAAAHLLPEAGAQQVADADGGSGRDAKGEADEEEHAQREHGCSADTTNVGARPVSMFTKGISSCQGTGDPALRQNIAGRQAARPGGSDDADPPTHATHKITQHVLCSTGKDRR